MDTAKENMSLEPYHGSNSNKEGNTMQSKDPEQRNAENSEEPTQRSITGFLWAIVVLAVLSFTFLYALDNTITANIRPGIVRTFDNNMGMLPWISVSYPLGEIGSCPFWSV